VSDVEETVVCKLDVCLLVKNDYVDNLVIAGFGRGCPQYIGQTSRRVFERFNEHKASVKPDSGTTAGGWLVLSLDR